jgi:hypothetical protein
VTVSVELPLFVSLVAVIVADPAVTPVTSPVVCETVATAVLLEPHVMVLPVRVFPSASFVVAVS